MTESPHLPARRADDAKAWFHLEHRRDIEDWVALRPDAATILHGHLIALQPAVQALADEVGSEVEVIDLDDGPWPRLGLWRPAWQRGGLHDVSVVIEWERDALLVPGPNCWPFTGVRSALSSDDKQRWNELVAALAGPRALLRAQRSRPWPLWRYEQPSADAEGVDPGTMALGLLTSLRQVWDLVAPVLDSHR